MSSCQCGHQTYTLLVRRRECGKWLALRVESRSRSKAPLSMYRGMHGRPSTNLVLTSPPSKLATASLGSQSSNFALRVIHVLSQYTLEYTPIHSYRSPRRKEENRASLGKESRVLRYGAWCHITSSSLNLYFEDSPLHNLHCAYNQVCRTRCEEGEWGFESFFRFSSRSR